MNRKTNSHFTRSTLAAALTLLCITSTASPTESTHTLPTWLVGCWVSADGTSLEAWSQDSDDTLIGFSSIVTDGRVSFYEMMSLRLDDDGRLIFTAYPSNQPGGSFPAVDQDESSVVFQNEAHDFPQRIRYRRADDQLIADIAFASGENQIDFNKTQCADE
ncbi:MAG: DUF6265 family protein [Pseudomonadota bacterium]